MMSKELLFNIFRMKKNIPYVEVITDYLETFSKFMKEDEDFIQWFDIDCIESIRA